MPTFLFDKVIFGPIVSRRLGTSLGINLLPVSSKLCSFNCIYCECGLNPRRREQKSKLPMRGEVREKLEAKLRNMQAENQPPDVITFAGNGEPTLHPDFASIVDDALDLRNRFAPTAKIAVLSNATMLHRDDVFNALLKVDDNILKLDSAMENTIRLIDCPTAAFSLEKLIAQLIRFNGRLIIQTMFIRGVWKGETIDNTTQKEVDEWIKLMEKIAPRQVMIYSIDRDTPIETLEKTPLDELEKIAGQLRKKGIDVQVSG
ncbi:MAG: radical SAM protein [Prolixibacteraceae bacterium]|nr:radical SAM protein [Prolixibacteraceae bacterium]